jgi:hypothetical protein
VPPMAAHVHLPSGTRVGYTGPMRLHIALDDDLVADLDRRLGPRRRTGFIAELIRRGLEDEHRWDDIEASLGALSDFEHDWDRDPAAWVRAQRRGDARRTG